MNIRRIYLKRGETRSQREFLNHNCKKCSFRHTNWKRYKRKSGVEAVKPKNTIFSLPNSSKPPAEMTVCERKLTFICIVRCHRRTHTYTHTTRKTKFICIVHRSLTRTHAAKSLSTAKRTHRASINISMSKRCFLLSHTSHLSCVVLFGQIYSFVLFHSIVRFATHAHTHILPEHFA